MGSLIRHPFICGVKLGLVNAIERDRLRVRVVHSGLITSVCLEEREAGGRAHALAFEFNSTQSSVSQSPHPSLSLSPSLFPSFLFPSLAYLSNFILIIAQAEQASEPPSGARFAAAAAAFSSLLSHARYGTAAAAAAGVGDIGEEGDRSGYKIFGHPKLFSGLEVSSG